MTLNKQSIHYLPKLCSFINHSVLQSPIINPLLKKNKQYSFNWTVNRIIGIIIWEYLYWYNAFGAQCVGSLCERNALLLAHLMTEYLDAFNRLTIKR